MVTKPVKKWRDILIASFFLGIQIAFWLTVFQTIANVILYELYKTGTI